MIDAIIIRCQNFRNRLFRSFTLRRDSIMDLIDAVASLVGVSSLVGLSMASLFRRKYSSITDALDNFGKESDVEKLGRLQLLAEHCSFPEKGFILLATDCTANPRIYAEKLEDRSIVHAPNHVPGQKPITVGHQYSTLIHLPLNPEDRKGHWVEPLSTARVPSHKTGSDIGLEKLIELVSHTVFKNHLCAHVSDSAYGNRDWIIQIPNNLENVVHIARSRNNRKYHRMPLPNPTRRKGRPTVYGEEISLHEPTPSDSEDTFFNEKGHRITVNRWNNCLARGQDLHKYPFDLVRVIVTNKDGKPLYKRPLWLMLIGKRKDELTAVQAAYCYSIRYDIEHYFRFCKQQLRLVDSQTPDVRHEESWHQVVLLAYRTLHEISALAQTVIRPWEKHKLRKLSSKPTPTQTQRDAERIIRQIGTPACVPKPRGKSPGRAAGVCMVPRVSYPIIFKKKITVIASAHRPQYARIRPYKSANVPLRQ